MHATRQPLEHYLRQQYRLQVIPDPDGGFFIEYPDLPGCMSQIERLEELPAAAEEIRELWIEAAYQAGQEIPEPVYPEEYSGKFNVRLPRSLHRRLAERAQEEGVSLNQLVVALLAEGLGKRTAESAVLGEITRIVGPAAASQRRDPRTSIEERARKLFG